MPIEKLTRLAQHLGGSVEIYAKREDCNSGLAFGGNKLRKLEYIPSNANSSSAPRAPPRLASSMKETSHERNRSEIIPALLSAALAASATLQLRRVSKEPLSSETPSQRGVQRARSRSSEPHLRRTAPWST